MSFEGPMLAAAIATALTSIPGALKNIYDLLKRPESGANRARELLDELRAHLLTLEELGHGLLELKDLHNTLQQLDVQLDGVRDYLNRALESPQFDIQAFKLSEVRKEWRQARFYYNGVVNSLSSLRFMDAALEVDEEGKPLAGPPWAVKLVKLRLTIDDDFKSSQFGGLPSTELVVALANNLDAFQAHTRDLMQETDKRIRDDFSALGPVFLTLGKGLHDVE